MSHRPSLYRRRRLALLLPGHNEEILLAATIESAIAAGQKPQDIYVVDDDSSDRTRAIAVRALPRGHVLTVPRSGKARAVMQAIEHFDFKRRYTWLHIADADSFFCPDYFRIYRKHLNARKFSAAVGFVQSMRGNWIATYRSLSYTYGQHIFRRLQSWFGVIAILPGPVTCFKTDILNQLDFETESLTEDFDLSLQIHRKNLGRIRFIPEAVNFTQDPRTLKDFVQQTLRWHRGFFQGLRRHRLGLRPHLLDASVLYQMGESVYYLLQIGLFIPLLILVANNGQAAIALLIADYLAIVGLAIFAAIAAKRLVILAALPYFYVLRMLELGLFLWAFVEVIVVRKFQTVERGWDTEGRRYEVADNNIRQVQ